MSTPTAPPMTLPTDPAPPAGRRVRLTGVDFARGLAVAGMIAVHSLIASDDDGNPTLMFRLSAGHASAMFAVLAGVAIAFLSGRTRLTPGPRSTGVVAGLAVRALVIGVIGLTLGYTDIEYGAVILAYYAVMFVLAIPLIFLSTRTVTMIAVLNALLMPVLSQLVRPHLPAGLSRQLSWETLLHQPITTVTDLLFTGEFPVLIWMTYVCVGVAVGRLDLRSTRVAGTLAGAGAALMLLASSISWMFLHPFEGADRLAEASDPAVVDEILAFGSDGDVPTDTWWWMAVGTPHTGTTLDLTATIGSTLMVLGLCLLLFLVPPPPVARMLRVVTAPVVAVGTMSLTAYVCHIMFVNSDFDVYDPWEGYLRQLVVLGVAAVAWRATAGRGPLEGLVTSITSRARRRAESAHARREQARPAGGSGRRHARRAGDR